VTTEEKGPEAGEELDTIVSEGFFGIVGRNPPKKFSTEVEPAAELLEKLHTLGWFWRLDSVMGGVICTLQKIVGDPKKSRNPERLTFQVGAATLPLAICSAAVKVIGAANKKETFS
jgi:hypothetical protein